MVKVTFTHGAALRTLTPDDFRDLPELRLYTPD